MLSIISKIIVLGIILLFIILFFTFVPVGLWISAIASGVKIGIINLIGMRLRRVKPAKIVMPMIKATKAGLDIKVNQLEAHYLAGGNVDSVVNALIAAQRAQMQLSFEIYLKISFLTNINTFTSLPEYLSQCFNFSIFDKTA